MLHRMKWLSLPIVALLPSACMTARSEPPASAPAPAARRIPLISYTPAQQAQVAVEIEQATAVDLWPDLIADYGRTRRAICAAEGWKQPVCQRIRAGKGAT
jgi:hypothetical protein